MTEVKCYWARSALSSVSTKKFIEVREFKRPEEESPIEEDGGSSDDFLDTFIEMAKDRGSSCHILKHFIDLTTTVNEVSSLEMYTL